MMNGEENQAHSRPEGQEDALPEKKRTWLLPLLSSLLFGFTLFVFAPLETWFSAGAELWFTVEDFLWPALAAFLTVSGVLFGVGMLFRGAGRSAFCALLFGLALALYVQGGFANADYGVLDGRAIDWPGFGDYPVWNTLMWVALALLPVVAVLLSVSYTHLSPRYNHSIGKTKAPCAGETGRNLAQPGHSALMMAVGCASATNIIPSYSTAGGWNIR